MHLSAIFTSFIFLNEISSMMNPFLPEMAEPQTKAQQNVTPLIYYFEKSSRTGFFDQNSGLVNYK